MGPRPDGRLNPFRETPYRIVDLTWGPRARRASPQRLRFMVERIRGSVVPIGSHEFCGASPRHFRRNLIGLRPDPLSPAPSVFFHFGLGNGRSSQHPTLSSVICHHSPVICHLPLIICHPSSRIGHQQYCTCHMASFILRASPFISNLTSAIFHLSCSIFYPSSVIRRLSSATSLCHLAPANFFRASDPNVRKPRFRKGGDHALASPLTP